MEGRVPIAHRRVIAAAGELELIVEVVAQDQPLDLDPVLVGPCCGRDLPEKGQALGETGGDVSGQLSQDEPLIDLALGLHVIDVRETEYGGGGYSGGLMADEPLRQEGRTESQSGEGRYAGGERTTDSAQDPSHTCGKAER